MTRESRDTYELFIEGEFRPASGSDRIDVTFPYTGETWATVPNATESDVYDAVRAAREAFDDGAWYQTTAADRRRILHQIADVVEKHTTELGRLETRQNGKLIREMEAQANILGEWFRYFGGLCETIEGRVIPTANKNGQIFTYTRKEPLGVVGAITPWNSPLLLTAFKLAPALAAGNTVVHKPSEHTPVSALRFAELVAESTDLPEGVYNIVTGGPKAGKALAEHEDVDKLAFTGSTSTGRKLGKEAGERLIPVSLELGGKSPNVVFESADIHAAVTGVIKGIFAASGQTCLAGSRVFVQETIYDEFLDQLIDRAEGIGLGDPLDPETEMGPLAFRNQWEKVHEYIEGAVEEGATVATGGEQPTNLPGECFIEPTILVDVDNNMRVAQEEIFGPVACVMPFADEASALDLANATDYGLAAGIWTEDMRQANQMIEGIDAGVVWVNEYRTSSYAVPFGGYKNSGLGRENGREGLEEYLQTKSVWIDHSGEQNDPFKLG